MKRKSGIFPSLSNSYSKSSPEAKEKVTSLGILALILALIFASGPLSALVINAFFNQTTYNAGDTVYTTLNVTTLSNEVFLAPVYYSVMASNGSFEFSNRQAQAVNCNSTNGYGYGYGSVGYGSGFGYGYGYGYDYTSGVPCSYHANFTLSDFQANGTYTLLSNVSDATNTTTFIVNQTLATGRLINSSGSEVAASLLFFESINASNSRSLPSVLGNFSINFNPDLNFTINITPAAPSLRSLSTAPSQTPRVFGNITLASLALNTTTVATNASSYTLGDTVVVSGNVSDDLSVPVSGATVIINKDSSQINTTTDGSYAYSFAEASVGSHIISVNVSKANYLPYDVSASYNVTGLLNGTTLATNASSYVDGSSANASGSVIDNLGSPVLGATLMVYHDGSLIGATSGGDYSATFNASGVGVHNITVNVSKANYTNFSVSTSYNVTGLLNGTTVSTNASSYVSGSSVNVSGSVIDGLGNSVSGATVAIYRDGVSVNNTTGGSFSYSFTDSSVGAHNITASVSKANYASYNASTNYTVTAAPAALAMRVSIANTSNAGDSLAGLINVTSNSTALGSVYYSLIAPNSSYEFANYSASNTSNTTYRANFTLSDFQANGTYTLAATVFSLDNLTNVSNTTTFIVNQTLATGRVINGSGTELSVLLNLTQATDHSNSRLSNPVGSFSINFNPNKNFKIRITPSGLDLPPLFTAVRSTPYAFGDIIIKKSIPPGLVQSLNGTPNVTVGNDTELNFNTSNTTSTSVIETLVSNNNTTANATIIIPVNLLGTNLTVNLTLNVANGTSRPIFQVPEQNLIISPLNATLTDVKINTQSQELRLTMNGSGTQDLVIFTTTLPKQFRFSNGTLPWTKLTSGTGLWKYAYSSVLNSSNSTIGYLINATVKFSSPGNLSVTWQDLNGTTVATDASSYSNGATVTVSGSVKDDLNASVSGANVTIYRDGTLINSTTGGSYSYAFADSTAGTHTILVNASLDGYSNSEVSTTYTVASSGGGGGSSSGSSGGSSGGVISVPPKKNVTTPAPAPVPPVPEVPKVEAPKDVTKPAEPVDTIEQKAIRDIITQASYDIDALSGQLSEIPGASALLNAARQKLAQADLMFSQGNYAQAKKLVTEARALIDQAESLPTAEEGRSFFKIFLVLVVLLSLMGAAVYYGYLKYGEKKVNPFTAHSDLAQPHRKPHNH